MVIFSEVGSQVEGIQRVAVFVVIVPDVEALVPVQFARTQEQRVAGAYKQVPVDVRLNWLQHMLLLPVQIDGDFREVVLLNLNGLSVLLLLNAALHTNPMTSSVES